MKFKGDDQFRFTDKELKAMGEEPVKRSLNNRSQEYYRAIYDQVVRQQHTLNIDLNQPSVQHLRSLALGERPIIKNFPTVDPNQQYIATIDPNLPLSLISFPGTPLKHVRENWFLALIGNIFKLFTRIFTHY